MSNKLKFNVNVDYVGTYYEKVGEEGKKDFNHPSNHKTNYEESFKPPMTNDDVVPLEDDDVWVAFDDDFNDEQRTNVISSNVLPFNLVHPIVGTFGSNMAQTSSVNVMLLALRQQTFNQQSLGLGWVGWSRASGQMGLGGLGGQIDLQSQMGNQLGAFQQYFFNNKALPNVKKR